MSNSNDANAWDVIIVGAGAAGLVAASRAAELGRRALLVEKNRQGGVKILMSGGTRCNITQATENRGIIAAYGPAGRFLHSALASLGVEQTLELFAAEGLRTKVEPTGKIFPESDRAADVLAALMRRLERSGCHLATEEPLLDIVRNDVSHDGVGFRLTTAKRVLQSAKVILTTGGQSYPGSGTTGDGYAWAASLGHTIVPPRPALTPLTVADAWPRDLRGVTLPDVGLRVLDSAADRKRDRALAQRRGSLLFAHFGLSGPVALDVSGAVSRHERPASLTLECDFLPGISLAELETMLRERSSGAGKRQVAAVLPETLPRRLADQLVVLAGMQADRKAAELTRDERGRLAECCKRIALRLTGTLGFKKAEVTSGGVALAEIDSSTMQSKIAPGLFVAGELLDLDGPIGGYNFQAAWSTGWLAGSNV
jgi:predicted Rossmann fold flavoprotein